MPVVVLSSREERRRDRVAAAEEEEVRECGVTAVVEEEKWRFQAEMLRAECNMLRMEKEIAVKKMERRRVRVERILRSAIHSLLTGRKKISEGKNVSMIWEEEINYLLQKLEKLQRRAADKNLQVRKFSNLDRQASFLQRRLEKFGGKSDEACTKEIREMAEASLSIKTSYQFDESFDFNSGSNMEILRRKIEGLSKGILLEIMEEYSSMLSTANNSAVSSSKQSELPDMPIRQPNKETMIHEEKACSGRCKAIVRRIVEQVRAETEQWSQMQEMLGQVRDEMEELQASRDFWEDRALDSDCQIKSLRSAVQEWRQKALSSEIKTNELQAELSVLHGEYERLRKDPNSMGSAKSSSLMSGETQSEKEKRVLICRLKENHCAKNNGYKKKESIDEIGGRKAQACTSGLVAPSKRSPLKDIENVSTTIMQNSNALFPLHYRQEVLRGGQVFPTFVPYAGGH